jgi:thymidine phosphorylase
MANTRGVQRCREVIHSGQALDKLHHWVSVQGGKNGEGPRRLETLVRQA